MVVDMQKRDLPKTKLELDILRQLVDTYFLLRTIMSVSLNSNILDT